MIKSVLKNFIISSFLISTIFAQSDFDSAKVYTLDETVITGTRIELEKSKIPASISILNRDLIEKNPHLNVLSQLSTQIPGLFLDERNIVGYGVGPTSSGSISIRGIGGSPNSQVLVLIDGQPQFMGLFGHPIHDAYMSSDIERVEVIRGPGSLLYGSNAGGGAINIITRKPESENISLQSTAAYGSFNTLNANLFGSYKSNGLSVIASVNHSNTDGHRTNGEDDFRNLTGFSKVSYISGRNFTFSLDGNLSDSKYYDPGPESSIRLNNFYNYKRGRAAFSVDNFFNNVEGALKLYYSYGKHDFFDGWRSDDNVKGITFYQNLKFYKDNVFTFGIDFKDYGGKGINNNIPPQAAKGLNREFSVSELDYYGIINYSFFNNLTLNSGIRFTDNSKYGLETIPQFGFSFRASSGLVIKGNAGKAFRSPTIADLFFFPVSNQNLEPERFWNYEIGVEKTFANNLIKTEMTLFYIEGTNLIQSIPPQQKINSGKFINKGIETAFSYLPSSKLKFNLNYSYLHKDKMIAYAPEHQFNFHTEYEIFLFRFMPEIKGVYGLYPFGGTEKQNYTIFSLTVNTNINKHLNIFVRGENLGDTKYYIDQGYPSPGINFMTGIKAEL